MVYPLDEILLHVPLSVLAGWDCWVEIARLGEAKLDLLRRFRPYEDGTPSHDQLGDIFAALDAEQFQSCFIAWTVKLTGLSADVIAIDGKTLRRSYQERRQGADRHDLCVVVWPGPRDRPGQGLGDVERDHGSIRNDVC